MKYIELWISGKKTVERANMCSAKDMLICQLYHDFMVSKCMLLTKKKNMLKDDFLNRKPYMYFNNHWILATLTI